MNRKALCAVLGAVCDVAAKHDMRLVVGLVTGWMSGRSFVPDALQNGQRLCEGEALVWQVRFVRHRVCP